MNRIMRKGTTLAAIAATSFVLGACEVTNPGPVQDEFLALEAAQQGLINGAVRSIAELYGNSAYAHALLAREIFPGGQTGAWGNGVAVQGGHILPGTFGGQFNDAQQARFIAETAIKRFKEADAPAGNIYQAHLWAGIAYRMMGELWCEAVVGSTDPDDTTPGDYIEGTTRPYFERALANFDSAAAYASDADETAAANAGRAQANVGLGNWAAAATAAAAVPDDFEFTVIADGSESDLYNDFFEATSGQFRSYTVQFTWFEDYYVSDTALTAPVDAVTNTGDPRVPWVYDPDNDVATASLPGFTGGPGDNVAAVPYKAQRKFSDRSDDYRLMSGWEMRLIEAEAILAQSQPFPGAMALINQVRSRNISDVDGNPLPDWTATSAEEAWTALKRERAIELWLEGRRAYDLRRWDDAGAPGEDDQPDWENPSNPAYTPLFTDNPRWLCFDISEGERLQNPNLPAIRPSEVMP